MTMNWIIKASVAVGALAALVAPTACGSTGGTGTGGASGGCTSDADCMAGEVCDTATTMCTKGGCKSNADCEADETCDTATGFCYFAGCLTDSDCLPGETCDTASGKCTGMPTMEPSCHQCACVDLLSMGGCANLCDSAQNGNPNSPNFCNGTPAKPQCAKCLSDNCGGITSAPDPTDPSACM
jgi:Cys-rich repeat protein